MSEINPYQTPQTFVEVNNAQTEEILYFPVSIKKLAILFMFTFGLYSIYWFYQNWLIIKERTQEHLLPIPRAIFNIFFVYSLFNRIRADAKERNIKQKWNAGPLATIFIVLTIASNLVNRMFISWVLLFLLMVPLITVQHTVNQLNNDSKEELNNKFTLANIIWMFIGSLIWLLSIAVFIYDRI